MILPCKVDGTFFITIGGLDVPFGDAGALLAIAKSALKAVKDNFPGAFLVQGTIFLSTPGRHLELHCVTGMV